MLRNWPQSPPWFPLQNADEAVVEEGRKTGSGGGAGSQFLSVPPCKFHFPQRGWWKLPHRTVPGSMRGGGEVHKGAREVHTHEAMGLPLSPGSVPVVCGS